MRILDPRYSEVRAVFFTELQTIAYFVSHLTLNKFGHSNSASKTEPLVFLEAMVKDGSDI